MRGFRNRYLLTLSLLLLYALNGSARDAASVSDITAIPDTLNVESNTAAEPDTATIAAGQVVAFAGNARIASDGLYTERPGRKLPMPNIYDMPYSMTANYPNWKNIGINSGVLFGAGILTLGVLQMLPENATSWNKKKISEVPFWKRWERNVRKGPVWDKDNFVFNYILHPYGGAVYYMAARSQGLNVFYSFLYSAGVSTLFWEYGVEAFMEIPSIQDLIITPTTGAILGEAFYLLKRHIVAHDYKLFGSGFLGHFTTYLIDPVNEVIGLFTGNPNKKKDRGAYYRENDKERSLTWSPWMSSTKGGNVTGYTLSLTF